MQSTAFERLQARFNGAEIVPLRNLEGVLSKSPSALYQIYRRKLIPFKLVKFGGEIQVFLADLAAWLEDPSRPSLPGCEVPDRAQREHVRGRPSLAEQQEAARLGLTVRDLRLAVRAANTRLGEAE
jgi:hypothetical protein